MPPASASPVIPSASQGNDSRSQWVDVVSKEYLDKVLPKHQRSILGGIEVRPKNVQFATQNKGEKVYVLLRKHWITNMDWIMSAALRAFIPVFLYVILRIFGQDPLTWFSMKLWLVVLLSFYAYIITYVFRHFLDWFFNLYIVTNERVVDYNVNIATTKLGAQEMALENIEEVKQQSIGVIQAFLNYGEVTIYSAADRSVVKFEDVPKPTFVRDIVSDLANVVKNYTQDES